MIATGGKLYEQCHYCRGWFNVAGFWKGIHICLTEEERRAIDQQAKQQAVTAQQGQLGTHASHNALASLVAQLSKVSEPFVKAGDGSGQ